VHGGLATTAELIRYNAALLQLFVRLCCFCSILQSGSYLILFVCGVLFLSLRFLYICTFEEDTNQIYNIHAFFFFFIKFFFICL
jgi:hypothetical protein